MSLYDHPNYYEIGFSYRDIPAETDFIEEAIRRYSQIPVRSILELASGTGPHLEQLCRRGYQYTGIDLNEQMIAFVQKKISSHGLTACVLREDMIDFALQEQADCAVVFLGSFYITTDAELTSHLASVARALRTGGLYILDAAVSYFPEDIRTQTWSESENGVTVTVTYTPRWVDRDHGLLKSTITLRVHDPSSTTRDIKHSELRKIYSFKQFLQIIHGMSSWQYVGSFSDFNIEAGPWDQGRNITIIRRT